MYDRAPALLYPFYVELDRVRRQLVHHVDDPSFPKLTATRPVNSTASYGVHQKGWTTSAELLNRARTVRLTGSFRYINNSTARFPLEVVIKQAFSKMLWLH